MQLHFFAFFLPNIFFTVFQKEAAARPHKTILCTIVSGFDADETFSLNASNFNKGCSLSRWMFKVVAIDWTSMRGHWRKWGTCNLRMRIAHFKTEFWWALGIGQARDFYYPEHICAMGSNSMVSLRFSVKPRSSSSFSVMSSSWHTHMKKPSICAKFF